MNNLRTSLIVTAFIAAFTALIAAPAPEKNAVINAGDNMRFSVTTITAAPGQSVHVQLHNVGTLPKEVMGHNWILLSSAQSAEAYATAAQGAKADNYEPKSLQASVLAVIPLLGPGKTGDVTFTAPGKPGKYPFLCSFPAHFAAGMRGVLVVQ